jgi:hypothetical protein
MPKRRLAPEAEWVGTKALRTISCVEEGSWLQDGTGTGGLRALGCGASCCFVFMYPGVVESCDRARFRLQGKATCLESSYGLEFISWVSAPCRFNTACGRQMIVVRSGLGWLDPCPAADEAHSPHVLGL